MAGAFALACWDTQHITADSCCFWEPLKAADSGCLPMQGPLVVEQLQKVVPVLLRAAVAQLFPSGRAVAGASEEKEARVSNCTAGGACWRGIQKQGSPGASRN